MIELVQRFDVLTEEQCSFIIQSNQSRLKQSKVGVRGSRVVSPIRSCSSCKIQSGGLRLDIELALFQSVNEIVGVPLDRIEPWELVNYTRGGYYQEHCDWFDSELCKSELEHGGQRTHSVVVYLSEVRRGGETVFPKLGATIEPRVGKLVAWNNTVAGVVQPKVAHAAKQVDFGTKWVLVTWIRERTFV